MPSRYEPQEHIQHLEVAPGAEGILDQRDITIQSYQTTVPFNYDALDTGLEGAWLTPHIRFGVFSRSHLVCKDALNDILGLQDTLSVRAYDYDERRPLWFSWRNVVVDTVNIHYFRDKDGLLCFTTTGGGRRITDDRLHDFNSTFLRIPKDAVSKRFFDLAKIRDLCFNKFVDRLYMLRFSDPSGEEYRSIDNARFQSRQYIDPKAERLQEVRADTQVKIESFDSDVTVRADDLASPIQVRFSISGLGGSLRLRFPKIGYKNQIKTPEEQARVFYRIVDVTARLIIDSDYYAQQRLSLEDLDLDLGMFPDVVNLTSFREVMTSTESRKEFFSGIDLGAPWQQWRPHLQAIDELLNSNVIMVHVAELIGELAKRDHGMVVRLLSACQADPKMHRVGAIVANALAGELQAIPAEMRAHAEETFLSWAIDQEQDAWDVDPNTGDISVQNLRWRVENLAFDVLPAIIWKLTGVLHARLMATTGDCGLLLRKFNWCMAAAKALPPHHSKIPVALKLVAAGRIPTSVADGAKVLKKPVGDFRALDDAVLNQFGLPLWPLLVASQSDGKIALSNEGIGIALAVRVGPAGLLSGKDGATSAFDLTPGKPASLPLINSATTLDMHFEKFGRQYQVTLPIIGEGLSAEAPGNIRTLPTAISHARRTAQRKYREEIDPQKIVVGSSAALLEVFENIHHANTTDGCPSVLLLGEPGVGKTHIAKLIHNSSERASRIFKEINAGGGGGDLTIQRGEWIGYGKGHGIQGIEQKGRPGHLMNADHGTLFIDELVAFSRDLQVIFLSVLGKRTIEKVGGESFAPDVRCIFATNAEVDKAIENGTLRQDLLDRIPIKIQVPPLRKRRGDIIPLAKHFTADHGITSRCLVALLRYHWPGNVRELQSAITTAIARMKSDGTSMIDLAHINLPAKIISATESLDEDASLHELWRFADEIARDEGFAQGAGLQRRAGEILGVGEGQASKMYHEHGLAGAATA